MVPPGAMGPDPSQASLLAAGGWLAIFRVLGFPKHHGALCRHRHVASSLGACSSFYNDIVVLDSDPACWPPFSLVASIKTLSHSGVTI